MSYKNLKDAIKAVIKKNGNEEITGDLMQRSLLAMINSLGEGFQFMGVANTETVPDTNDTPRYYLATEDGEYIGFGLKIEKPGIYVLSNPDGVWKADTLMVDKEAVTVDAELSETSENPVQNRVITSKLNELEDKAQSPVIEVSMNKEDSGMVANHTWDEIRKFIQNEVPLRFLFEGLDIATPTEVNYQDAEDGYYSGIVSTTDFRREFRIDHTLTVDITDTYGLQTFVFEVGSYNDEGQAKISTSIDTIRACVAAFDQSSKSVRIGLTDSEGVFMSITNLWKSGTYLYGQGSFNIGESLNYLNLVGLSPNEGESFAQRVDASVDLSNYYTKEETNTKLSGYALKESIKDLAPADEEDLTLYTKPDSSKVIRLKDRDTTNGMGYKILRLPEDKILTQDMINEANTIYEIRYDFDLNGATITVPEGCTLKFEGGSLKNGSIVFSNTFVESSGPVFQNIEVQGSLKNTFKYAKWFNYPELHDDWSFFELLLKNGGTVYLEDNIYNLNKSLHQEQYLDIESNTTIKGKANTKINEGHSTTTQYSTLFNIREAQNITISNIEFLSEESTLVSPPAGHSGDYYSCGIYTFSLVNTVKDITLNHIRGNNLGFLVKSSAESSFTGTENYENVKIIDCSITADNPIQGLAFNNLEIRNSFLEGLGKNNGLHVIYALPSTKTDEIINNSIYIDNCCLIEDEGGGYNIHIYDALDTVMSDKGTVYISNSQIYSASSLITGSVSAKIIFNNCIIKCSNSESVSPIGGAGLMQFYDCRITNAILYTGEYYNSELMMTTTDNNLIVGDNSIEATNMILKGCNISLTKSLIYNLTDAVKLKIEDCSIKTTYTDLMSFISSSTNDIVLSRCSIAGNIARLAYCPNKTGKQYYKFNFCNIHTKESVDTLFNTGYPNPEENALVVLNSCIINDKKVLIVPITSSVTVSCLFNINYQGDNITSLEINTLKRYSTTDLEEVFQFSTGTTTPTITITGVSWANGDTPTFAASKTYEIHIMYNSTLDKFLATYATYD